MKSLIWRNVFLCKKKVQEGLWLLLLEINNKFSHKMKTRQKAISVEKYFKLSLGNCLEGDRLLVPGVSSQKFLGILVMLTKVHWPLWTCGWDGNIYKAINMDFLKGIFFLLLRFKYLPDLVLNARCRESLNESKNSKAKCVIPALRRAEAVGSSLRADLVIQWEPGRKKRQREWGTSGSGEGGMEDEKTKKSKCVVEGEFQWCDSPSGP